MGINTVVARVPKRSHFNLSHSMLFDGDFGYVYPVDWFMGIPSDIHRLGCDVKLRMNPMVAPIMTPVKLKTRTFAVPLRLLGKKAGFDWELFYTGGPDGTDDTQILPRWTPSAGKHGKGSLWNFLVGPDCVPSGALPLDFVREAYEMIINEYFLYLDLDNELEDNEDLFIVRYKKDYFTGATLQQQRGTAPSLPISFNFSSDFEPDTMISEDYSGSSPATGFAYSPSDVMYIDGGGGGEVLSWVNPSSGPKFLTVTSPFVTDVENNGISAVLKGQTSMSAEEFSAYLNSAVSSFNVNDWRLATSIQLYLERNNRAGSRYVDQLKIRFGVSPRDDRLDRPEYLGGMSTPIIVSEVLQTSSTTEDSPQGNLSGHGITIDTAMTTKYHCQEFCLIMTLAYVVPQTQYFSDGIDRQLLYDCRFDFPAPEFTGLGDQLITRAEILATNSDVNNTAPFGFTGRYNELRYSRNRIVGKMETDFAYWSIARKFDKDYPPELNSSFVEYDVSNKSFLAVPSESAFICNFGIIHHAYRPIPKNAVPRC